ncbi:FixH family protein [Brevibacillus sp. GCM10020057]|uniref:FixH family protein n=1 Tax=Brevibacillus sp. GCM10020057 TaxID=3317327 RepID=UPI003631B10A
MKRYLFSLLVLLAAMTAACGHNHQEAALPSADPVAADFAILPKEPAAGKPITFSVKVTQNGEPVNDAKEVKFEWWKDGQEQHVTIPASLQKDGVYTARQTIDEAGSYFVYYHVTARDFHNMQKVAFTVGGQSASSASPAHAQHPGEATAEHEHEAAEHAHASGVDFHFMPPTPVLAGQPTPLMVHLMKDNASFTKAAVRFEIWQGSAAEHTFVEAREEQPGQYSAEANLPAAGSYTVKVHVEKGEIHDHKSFPLAVQPK